MESTSLLARKKVARRARSDQGFTLVESIIIVAVFVAIGFTIYYLGWGAREKAGGQALAQDIKTTQNAVADYLFDSYLATHKGQYPTDDGTLPGSGESKLIFWDASFISDNTPVYFKEYFGKDRLPRHWDEGVWRIDGLGDVTVDIDPDEY